MGYQFSKSMPPKKDTTPFQESLLHRPIETVVPKKVITALQESLLHGSIEIILRLLNTEYDAKLTSLVTEPTIDKFEKCRIITEICLNLEIDLNLSESKYPTLLHFVTKNLDEETFRLILRRNKDFDINALNPDNRALLHVLVDDEKENLVKELLDYGANINIQELYGNTPLHYAIKNNNSKLVRCLIDHGADVNLKNLKLNSPLHYAVYVKNEEIIQMLLDTGAAINAKNGYGQEPIFGACALTKKEINFNYDEKSLTKQGKNIDRVFNLEIMKLLSAHGADLNVKDKEGITMLHAACKGGRLDVVHFLVDLGADLHSKENDGGTTLHKAVLGNNFNLIEFLLLNSLDIDVRDKRGETPLHKLTEFSQYTYNELYFVLDKSFRDKKFKEYVDMVEFLVDNGADVNALDGNSVTPLEKTIYLNFLEICENLLELKASIEFRKDVILFSYYMPISCVTEFTKRDKDTDIETLRLLTALLATRKDDISQYIDAISKNDVRKFQWVEPLFQKCKLEGEQMKKINICEERNVSFLDFLTKDLVEVIIFSRSEEVMAVLESLEYKKQFPSFDYLLEKRIARVKKLRNCTNVIINFLEEYAKMNLPIVVLDKIFSFLGTGDVRNFGRALSVNEN